MNGAAFGTGLRNEKSTIVREKREMFPGDSETNHIGGVIKEPIKLSV